MDFGIFNHVALDLDFSQVANQHHAKRALEIAAAGWHHILMIGPPGTGKTMLARRVPSILPAMSPQEAQETTEIYIQARIISPDAPLMTERPFRAPHHTVSVRGLVGTSRYPVGEVSLAHNGVLFFDELPEFSRAALEALRNPIRQGHILFVGAMNPEPPMKEAPTTTQMQAYWRRINSVIGLFNIFIEVERVPPHKMTLSGEESSASIRARVERAWGRSVQIRRMDMDSEAARYEDVARKQLPLGVEDVSAARRVAGTIARLDHSDIIRVEHMSEAIQYRAFGGREFL